jgi:proteasome accessory factor A
VIVGDANLCEVATFLKVGATSVVLSMIEDGFIDKDLSLASPVPTMRKISHDPSCRTTFSLADGSSVTAVELQWEFFRLAQKYADEVGLDSCGDEAQMADLMRRWEATLTALEDDPRRLDGQLDWVTKYNLLDAYAARNGLEWGDPKLALMDLQYHDVRPERSLYEKLVKAGKVERLLNEDDVIGAITEPPATTRAYFRGKCLARWSESVVAANWDSMIFDLGADPLKRIPMMEPLRGTKAHVDELLDGCATPADLVARLSA